MMTTKESETSKSVLARVIKARKIQLKRYEEFKIKNNAALKPSMLRELCPLDEESKKILRLTVEVKGYSARSFDRIIRVARTIADLEGSGDIRIPHIAEAVQHHRLDRLQEL
jgi:magnesium chelatase family protein